jgi:hypothetical protein
VDAGAGATLLIHEATFEACMDSHALAKRHSTLQEALQVAEQMGAYRCGAGIGSLGLVGAEQHWARTWVDEWGVCWGWHAAGIRVWSRPTGSLGPTGAKQHSVGPW